MKKWLILYIFVGTYLIGFTQHEGIERHFSSYTFNLYPIADYSLYSDTTTDNFFNFLPQHKYSQHFFGFENPGTPFKPMLFSERSRNHKFFFFNNYYPYIHHHNSIIYFDAQKPFTLFTFSGGAREVEMVRFLHTQNVNQNFNFGIDIDIINSDGHFMNNEAKVNALTLFTAYTKKRYESHANFIFNKIDHYENGGISSDSVYENTNIRTHNLDTRLNQAQKTISQLGLQYSHEYRFGEFSVDTIVRGQDSILNYMYDGKMSVIQDFKANRFYHIYSDVPTHFYNNIYNDSVNTFDSTALIHFEHSLYLSLDLINDTSKNRNLKLYAGIRNEIYNYNIDSVTKNYQNHYLSGHLLFENRKNIFRTNLDYCFAGTGMFDLNISAYHNYKISKKLSLTSQFGYELTDPDRLLWYYRSNHFSWDNEFRKYMAISGSTKITTDKMLSFGTNINFINNYVIFNLDAKPEQIDNSNFIADVFISKLLKFGNFNWYNKISWQYVTNREYLPLPEYLAYTSLYFKTDLFNNAATFQTGISGRYHSQSYAYAYMPAISAYYLQQNRTTGNHFILSYSIAVQVKRLRGFVRLSNFNDMFMARGSYLMLHTPENPFSVNFGISWEFYD